MSKSKIEHLVLSGGGLLGISYIGIFKYCEENNIFTNIKRITGCSAGAIFGSLLAIGYTTTELDTIIKTMIFKDYLKINVDSILNFINTKGFESGKKLNIFIKKCIKDKTGDENITFSQIKEKYNIKLQIGVTNLTKSKFELLNIDTSPDLPIEQAISASIAIPFIFEPIIIGNDIYCDGGLLDNLPIHEQKQEQEQNFLNPARKAAFKKTRTKMEVKESIESIDSVMLDEDEDEDEDDETDKEISINNNHVSPSVIGFYLLNKNNIINKDNYTTSTLSQYISLLTQSLSKNLIYNKKQIENTNKNKYKIIVIEIPTDIMTFIKLNASHSDINNIIDIAYNITKNELN